MTVFHVEKLLLLDNRHYILFYILKRDLSKTFKLKSYLDGS